MHSNSIVHGDLKGVRHDLFMNYNCNEVTNSQGNILVSDEGFPQICDFGLSKIAGVTTESKSGVRGTFNWMAPELLLGDSKTQASDVYAFGMLVVEVGNTPEPSHCLELNFDSLDFDARYTISRREYYVDHS